MIKLKFFVVVKLIYLLSIIFWGSSCVSLSQNVMSGDPQKENQSDKEVLLELVTDASETVYPPGKTLDLRVYKDGMVEFDFYPLPTPDRIGIPFSSELKRATINKDDLSKIKSLLGELESDNPKSKYSPTRVSVDSHIINTLTYESKSGKKQIILEENDSHLHLEEKSNVYPPSLIKLLNLVLDIGGNVRRPLYEKSKNQ